MSPGPLSEAQKRHLLELEAAPHWGPGSPGEWAVARALEARGLLTRNVSAGKQPYSLNTAGREAAQALRLLNALAGPTDKEKP